DRQYPFPAGKRLILLPPPAEKLQNFFGVFLQFQIGVDTGRELFQSPRYSAGGHGLPQGAAGAGINEVTTPS
ncbi:MAG: hypothetical protein NC319_05285, partial [Butyricicoccus sp.]|nr:hypothetical protein [Butyricicoccus sp.]